MSIRRSPGLSRVCIPLILMGLLILRCRLEMEPEITVGVDGCSACGMVVDDERQAGGYYLEREFHPFCSAGCLLESFERRRRAGRSLPRRIYFADYLGGGLQPADSVEFLLTGHRATVMGWGILAFGDPQAARSYRRHEDEVLTDWLGVRTLRGVPDRTLSVTVTGKGMEPEVVALAKGELVVWEIRGRGLGDDVRIRVRGYEELGEILVPASGEIRSLRVLATKPGDGFPVIGGSDGRVLGRLRVEGPHTADEEEV